MEVRKRRAPLGCSVLLLVVTVAFVFGVLSRPVRTGYLIAAGVYVVAVVALFGYALRPFRFAIEADGLTVRRRGFNRHLSWSEVETVLLVAEKPDLERRRPYVKHQLLLVPAAGVDLGVPLTARSPMDDRPCLPLLDLADTRSTTDEVVEALARFSGGRFVDVRHVLGERFRVEFPIVSRGYDPAQVDQLLTAGREALVSGDPAERVEARLKIEAAALPRALRGYDTDTVDRVLRTLAAELAGMPGDDRKRPDLPGPQ